MKRIFPWLLILCLALAACGGNSGDDDDDDNDHSADDDSNGDDDDDAAGDDDSGDDDNDDSTPGAGWSGVTIASVNAPNEYSILVTLSADPGAEAGEAALYAVTSDNGDLEITQAQYDAPTKLVTLQTRKQKLGVEYTLTVTPPTAKKAPLTAQFTAADTAAFWAWDFAEEDEYQLTANRAGVGEHCVIYVEQGSNVADVAETIAAFDEQIYPIETELFIAAPDFDGNDRITLLSLSGGIYYGGYFFGVNAESNADALSMWGLHSNEMEIIYINADGGSLEPVHVIPHEFQHLLYHEKHGWQNVYWDYHDEGLAETAVHAVYGINQYSLDYYLSDPSGSIGRGRSLVHWTYADYDSYVQAYLWWIYLAGRLGGLDHLADIFNLENGDPEEVTALIDDAWGSDMPTTVLQNELAIWVQDDSGPYSFNGLLSFPAGTAPTVPAGYDSVDLEPYAGAIFLLDDDLVNYPGTQGAHILYAGIDPDGNVDLAAPFQVSGGALLAYNSGTNTVSWPAEHSGPDLSAVSRLKTARFAPASPAWRDPPPFNPEHPEVWRSWGTIARERER
ncbi:MAG: hypothetical protein GX444_12565 [Myxococcales bacterium]|nr:hypothetical protein [Myxococcales bacterium]